MPAPLLLLLLDWAGTGGQPGATTLLDGVTRFGVILLVGVTASRLDAATFRRHRRPALLVSALGIALPLALGLAAGWFAPSRLIPEGADRGVSAAFVGVALGSAPSR